MHAALVIEDPLVRNNQIWKWDLRSFSATTTIHHCVPCLIFDFLRFFQERRSIPFNFNNCPRSRTCYGLAVVWRALEDVWISLKSAEVVKWKYWRDCFWGLFGELCFLSKRYVYQSNFFNCTVSSVGAPVLRSLRELPRVFCLSRCLFIREEMKFTPDLWKDLWPVKYSILCRAIRYIPHSWLKNHSRRKDWRDDSEILLRISNYKVIDWFKLQYSSGLNGDDILT
jgi:hypothetical protein